MVPDLGGGLLLPRHSLPSPVELAEAALIAAPARGATGSHPVGLWGVVPNDARSGPSYRAAMEFNLGLFGAPGGQSTVDDLAATSREAHRVLDEQWGLLVSAFFTCN